MCTQLRVTYAFKPGRKSCACGLQTSFNLTFDPRRVLWCHKSVRTSQMLSYMGPGKAQAYFGVQMIDMIRKYFCIELKKFDWYTKSKQKE